MIPTLKPFIVHTTAARKNVQISIGSGTKRREKKQINKIEKSVATPRLNGLQSRNTKSETTPTMTTTHTNIEHRTQATLLRRETATKILYQGHPLNVCLQHIYRFKFIPFAMRCTQMSFGCKQIPINFFI